MELSSDPCSGNLFYIVPILQIKENFRPLKWLMDVLNFFYSTNFVGDLSKERVIIAGKIELGQIV